MQRSFVINTFLKSYFSTIQHNYLVLLTEEKILQDISQDSLKRSLESINVDQLEKKTIVLEEKLAESLKYCEDFNNELLFLVDSIVASKVLLVVDINLDPYCLNSEKSIATCYRRK